MIAYCAVEKNENSAQLFQTFQNAPVTGVGQMEKVVACRRESCGFESFRRLRASSPGGRRSPLPENDAHYYFIYKGGEWSSGYPSSPC